MIKLLNPEVRPIRSMTIRLARKAQAAMEFLTTYGWAILVVLAAIGALAYFGVLDPSNMLPSTCEISPGFGCPEYAATSRSFTFILQNAQGKEIQSAAVQFPLGQLSQFSSTCGDLPTDLSDNQPWVQEAVGGDPGYESAAFIMAPWKNGDAAQLTVGTGTECSLPGGGGVTVNFRIKYSFSGGSYLRQATGSLRLKVQG